MDDFDEEEYEYDNNNNYYEEDEDDGKSLKEKYDDAKEKYDKIKEKYDKLKEKSNKFNDPSNVQSDAKKFNENLRAGKKTSSEAGKKAGEEAGKETSKQASKQAGKEAGKQAGKQAGKEAGKQAGKQAGKEAGKQVAKQAAKEGVKRGVQAGASATGYGVIIAAAIEVADQLNKIKKKIDKKVDNQVEQATGVKNFSKKKKWILPLAIIAIFVLFTVFVASAMYVISETATQELRDLVAAREETNKKELILFTKGELKDLLKKDIILSDDVVKTLIDKGYNVEEDKKSYCYKSILKNYGKGLSEIFFTTNLDKLSDDLTEDIIDDADLENDAEKVSLAQVGKYLLAEVDNFNKINWQKSSLQADYGISGDRKSKKYSGDHAYTQYLSDPNKVKGASGTILDESVVADYTVKDENGKSTMIKTPNFTSLGVSGDKNELALSYAKMLSPYMQKWIIPYAIMIDTQDEEFVNSIMSDIYHPVDVKFFQLKKLVKTVTFEYYLKCHTYEEERVVIKIDGKTTTDRTTKIAGSLQEGKNTRDEPLGRTKISTTEESDEGYYEKRTRYKVVELDDGTSIAKDSSGNPLVKSIKIERKIENAETIPEITYIGGFYEILEKEFEITPIDETKSPNESSTDNLSVDSKGIGTQTLTESWKEEIKQTSYNMTSYELSYLSQEDLEQLGRRVSIIEWYQDSKGMVSRGEGSSGTASSSISSTRQQYIETYKQDAINDMNESGVLASITLAQGIIEGNSGQSTLTSQYNNHFGIKAGSSWTGATAVMRTREYTKDGKPYYVNAAFRAYSSAADSFADHSRFLWNTKGSSSKPGGYRYRDTTDQARSMTYMAPDGKLTYNYRAAIQAIVDGGYCTDPNYVSMICSIIETYKLYELDRECTWDGTPPAYATGGATQATAGSRGSSSGGGTTQYSYEDMEFAFYQIEKWYEEHSTDYSALNLSDSVILPEGGFAWPVSLSGNQSAEKIYRFHNATLDNRSTHKGIDVSTGNVTYYDSDAELKKGAIVVATHDGKVSKVEKVKNEDSNAYVEIKTEDGLFKTKYCYLSEINVKEGDEVTKGQTIGRIGNTGGAHSGDTDLYLHYEIYYKGENMDPLTYYYIKDSSGKRVDDYDALDKTNIAPYEYAYDGSREYLYGEGNVVEGDVSAGIEFVYTSGSGRTYNCYLQNRGPWKSSSYGSRTIAAQGCSITSVATILTGYGYNVNPGTYAGGIKGIFSLIQAKIPTSHAYTYKGVRIDSATPSHNGGPTEASRKAIINHLLTGKPAIVHVIGPGKGGSNQYAHSEHWMAILEIRQSASGYEVFVDDPNYNTAGRGWRSLESMLVSLCCYILVDEDG